MKKENLIHSMTFDLEVPSSMGKDAAMDETESCCDDCVIPVIDEVITHYGALFDADIENITLDLGEVSREEMPTKLKSLLEDEIIRHLYYSSQGQGHEAVKMEEKDTNGLFILESQEIHLPDLGIAQYLFEGMLPWQYAGLEQAFLPDLWDEVSRALEIPSQVNLFFARLSKEPLAMCRFVNMLDVEQLKVILASSLFLGESACRNLLTVLESIESQELRFSLRHALSVVAYALIGRYGERIEAQKATEKEGNFLVEAKDYPYVNMDDVIQPDDFNGYEMALGVDGVMRKVEKNDRNPLGKSESEPQTRQRHETRGLDDKETAFWEKWKAYEQEMTVQKEWLLETAGKFDANSLCIDDAGLVLLHPFLTNLFDRLGYLDEEQGFRNMHTRERAVHLLRFMAGFKPPYYDHQLTLEKVMCDLPLAFPVSLDVELETEEKEEARQVLEAVCQYWTPLNGTSPEGLQRSFMLRQGTIAFEDDTWIIRVEGQALDILLDDLPWEISLLLLPWKEEMIMVEWQHE